MSAHQTGPLPGTIGRYIVAGKIGSGGMGTVYRATDPDSGEQVAIKVLAAHLVDDENSRRRFEREASTVIHFNHPLILPVYGMGEEDRTPYLVMRLLSGRSLADLLQGGPLPVEQIGRFTRQIASALDYAHAHHVIHRDVKPKNVLLDDQDTPYLADFGVAYYAGARSSARLTTAGEFVGTAAYAAPEQCEGKEPGRSADIYSLAVMVFQMATGRLPFEAPNSFMVIKMHLQDPPPNPLALNPHLPIQFYPVLARALAKDPSARYPSAMKFSEAVDEALGLHVVEQPDGGDDWLRSDLLPVTPDGPPADPWSPPPEPSQAEPEAGPGFQPDMGTYGGPEDPFEGIDLEEPGDSDDFDDFDDHFDLQFEAGLEPGGDFPPAGAVLEPAALPEPDALPPRHTAIRAIGTPPPAPARRPAFPWTKVGIYGTIAISLVALLAAAVIAYTQFFAPSPALDATTASAAAGVRFDYPAAWHVAAGDLAVLSADSAPAVTLADQPVAPGGPYDPAALVIAVQRIDPATVFQVPASCLDRIAGGPQDTFACMASQHYAMPVYERFDTPRHRGIRLPGTLPPARASLPVILLPTGGPRWIAVMIIHWNGYDDAYGLQERVAKSVRITDQGGLDTGRAAMLLAKRVSDEL
jgi:serine/threonine protein kinase